MRGFTLHLALPTLPLLFVGAHPLTPLGAIAASMAQAPSPPDA